MIKADLKTLTVHAAADMLAAGEISSVELCKAYIERIDQVDSQVKAFLKLDREDIFKHAAEADSRRTAGNELSPYDGIPVGIKRLYCQRKTNLFLCFKTIGRCHITL